MPGVLFGVNVTPMAGVEVLHPEKPNRNKLNVRRAIDLQSNRADVRRFTMPSHTGTRPVLVTGASSFGETCYYKLLKYSRR
jgi:hypothetical protein